jgi:tRNA nucleotidyltransferase (CCA-adding enzyme)
MKIYLVGGAVRDRLLDLPVTDRDWVVVGATEAEMLALGYRPLDRAFPVFLHPQSGEEYALARRETKVGPGYKGFTVYAGPDVTLEEDLRRRDLTINAMAQDEAGELIDLFNGREDLDAGLLRHITPAFVEDPVRLLRVARFAARFGRWGFHVAHGTHALMRRMAASDDLSALRPERLWQEMKQALAEEQPWRFFEVLQRCGALARLIPELAQVMGTGEGHGEQQQDGMIAALQRAAAGSDEPRVRFAVAFAAAARLGDDVNGLLQRLRVEREYADLLQLLLRHDAVCVSAAGRDPERLLDLLEGARALQRPDRFQALLDSCAALWPVQMKPLLKLMPALLRVLQTLTAQRLRQAGLQGAELGRALRQRRIEAIDRLLCDNPEP